MKKITPFFMLIFAFLFASGQNNKPKHGDSILFQGTYYAPADYKKVKDDYEKVHYEAWFMPGLAYAYYQPKKMDSVGYFQGVTVEYLIYARIFKDEKPGPSQTRVYVKLNMLNSSKDNINSLFMYTFGVDLSLERNPARSFLIPYFGLEFGGISQKQLGSTVQFTPTFGVHIFSKKNLFVNLQGGYVYPVSNYEVLQGWTGQAGLNFALW